jgi:hypothetical protein
MKKFLAFALSVALLLSMAGCSSIPSFTKTSSTEDTAEDVTEDTVEDVAEDTQSPASTTAPTISQDNNSGVESLSSHATIEETVLVDEADVKITATDLSYSDYQALLHLTIENNTDQDLSFHSGSGDYSDSINGYMVDYAYLTEKVLAGKKSNETLSFDLDELALLGITEISDISVCFDIEDENYDTYLQTDPVQIKTSLYDAQNTDSYFDAFTSNSALADLYGYSLVYAAQDELYNQDGVRLCSEILVEDSEGELTLLIEVENTSQDILYTSVSDAFINGLGVYPYTWTTTSVNPGTRRVIDLSLDYIMEDLYWDVFGITDISDIAFALDVRDTDYNVLSTQQFCQVSITDTPSPLNTEGTVVYDDNGLQIISKGLYNSDSIYYYSDDTYLLFLVKNDSDEPLYLDVDYDTVSVNGYMTDFWCAYVQIPAGQYSILEVELDADSLTDAGIEQLSDITDLELTFEISDTDYNILAEPTVTLTF